MSLYEYLGQLDACSTRRYKEKLELVGLTACPYQLPADAFIDDPQQWPRIEYGDIYNYLIKSPRLYSPEAMENYRSLEAHRFFTSGWVGTVSFFKTPTGMFIFRADVKPSWRVTDNPHHPWVAVTSTGPVAAAHCDCMAGLGETCSHIAAVLFKLEAAVRLGYTSRSVTDQACAWNACFVKKVTAARVADIRFYKEKAKQMVKSPAKAKGTEAATEEQQGQLLEALAAIGDGTAVVGLSSFSKYSHRFEGRGPSAEPANLPLPLSKLPPEQLRTLSITETQANLIEQVTRAQSSSLAWFAQREGRITASVAREALATNQENPAPSLVKKICSPGKKLLNVPAINWGREHEQDAFSLYAFLLQSSPVPNIVPSGNVYITNPGPHRDFKVSKCGLFISTEKPFLAASPDGLIRCSCCGEGVLEIKAPFRARDSDLLTDSNLKYLGLDENFQVDKTHQFYAQVQLQMFCSSRQYGDLLIWTPIDCIVTRVNRDNEFIVSMVEKLERLWKTAVLPRLLGQKEQPGSADNHDTVQSKKTRQPEASSVYCVCRGAERPGMVGCDRCNKWFHIDCIGLKKLPRTKNWYCRPCRQIKGNAPCTISRLEQLNTTASISNSPANHMLPEDSTHMDT